MMNIVTGGKYKGHVLTTVNGMQWIGFKQEINKDTVADVQVVNKRSKRISGGQSQTDRSGSSSHFKYWGSTRGTRNTQRYGESMVITEYTVKIDWINGGTSMLTLNDEGHVLLLSAMYDEPDDLHWDYESKRKYEMQLKGAGLELPKEDADALEAEKQEIEVRLKAEKEASEAEKQAKRVERKSQIAVVRQQRKASWAEFKADMKKAWRGEKK